MERELGLKEKKSSGVLTTFHCLRRSYRETKPLRGTKRNRITSCTKGNLDWILKTFFYAEKVFKS